MPRTQKRRRRVQSTDPRPELRAQRCRPLAAACDRTTCVFFNYHAHMLEPFLFFVSLAESEAGSRPAQVGARSTRRLLPRHNSSGLFGWFSSSREWRSEILLTRAVAVGADVE